MREYLTALIRFQAQRFWLTATLRNSRPCPASYIAAFGRLSDALTARTEA
jgi:hypothetical protein